MQSSPLRFLISNQKVVKLLKSKRILPLEIEDDFILPADPDKRFFLVRVLSKSLLASKRDMKISLIDRLWEKRMNYNEMCEAVREGKKCTRPTWRSGEYVFSNGKILIHTTPYWTNEMINQELKGYPYVCEQVDVIATDWSLCEHEFFKIGTIPN